MKRWALVLMVVTAVGVGVALTYPKGPRFPSWVEAANTLKRRIKQIEGHCKNPSRDLVQWEVCESSGKSIVWINYPGEHSAYEGDSGDLVYYWTGQRCEANGPWYQPWKGETCSKSFRETGTRPNCGTFPVCDPDAWANPCTSEQISHLGCANFGAIRVALESVKPE